MSGLLGLAYGSDDEDEPTAPSVQAAAQRPGVLTGLAAAYGDDADAQPAPAAAKRKDDGLAPGPAPPAKRPAAGRDSPGMAALGLIRKATAGGAAAASTSSPQSPAVAARSVLATRAAAATLASSSFGTEAGDGDGNDGRSALAASNGAGAIDAADAEALGVHVPNLVAAIDAVPLPPQPDGEVSPALQAKLAAHLSSARSLVAHLYKLRSFRNHTLYAKLIEAHGLDEHGSNYPKDKFDRTQLNPDAYYDKLGTGHIA